MTSQIAATKKRDSYLQRTYGITLAQYNPLFEKQKGCCAICGKSKAAEGKNLSVDHDHKRLVVRGLLCSYCNRYLVGRHTDAEVLDKIAAYLRQDTGWKVPPKKRKSRRKKKKK